MPTSDPPSQSNLTSDAHQREVASGQRFEFGSNWSRFLTVLDEDRIAQAERSLQSMLGLDRLDGLSFLDIGSGSGLFSLAARRLGARVHSFDYDPRSVECTKQLRMRFFPHDPDWIVESGSILDASYLSRLPRFDVVYSWGVLHHTGAMWTAFAEAGNRVAAGGRLFIAIYNDQGGQSRRWLALKKAYNRLPRFLRPVFAAAVMGPRELLFLAVQTLRGQPGAYFRNIRDYSRTSSRGMSYWHDIVDWIGGLPFEVAKPEQVFDFYRARGFVLCRLRTFGGALACNEYVFQHSANPHAAPKE